MSQKRLDSSFWFGVELLLEERRKNWTILVKYEIIKNHFISLIMLLNGNDYVEHGIQSSYKKCWKQVARRWGSLVCIYLKGFGELVTRKNYPPHWMFVVMWLNVISCDVHCFHINCLFLFYFDLTSTWWGWSWSSEAWTHNKFVKVLMRFNYK